MNGSFKTYIANRKRLLLKLLVTRGTEKQTLVLVGYKHATIVEFGLEITVLKVRVKICLFIR